MRSVKVCYGKCGKVLRIEHSSRLLCARFIGCQYNGDCYTFFTLDRKGCNHNSDQRRSVCNWRIRECICVKCLFMD